LRGGENRCPKLSGSFHSAVAVGLQEVNLKEPTMRCRDYLFPGVFAPVLSLDQLYANREEDGSFFDLVDTASTPLQSLEIEQAFSAINKFVDDLPPRDRQIVRSVFWQGRSQSDVANDLKVSKMAISKAMARICARGRTALADNQFFALA
jgi:RNA polymerase sigma factor (sigma-70 family)